MKLILWSTLEIKICQRIIHLNQIEILSIIPIKKLNFPTKVASSLVDKECLKVSSMVTMLTTKEDLKWLPPSSLVWKINKVSNLKLFLMAWEIQKNIGIHLLINSLHLKMWIAPVQLILIKADNKESCKIYENLVIIPIIKNSSKFKHKTRFIQKFKNLTGDQV